MGFLILFLPLPRSHPRKDARRDAKVPSLARSGTNVFGGGGGGGIGGGAISPLSSPRGAAAGGIGGFHVVQIPLSEEVQTAVRSLCSGSAADFNWIEMAVSEDQSKITLEGKGMFSPAEIHVALHETEPRFYLYAWNHTRNNISKTSVRCRRWLVETVFFVFIASFLYLLFNFTFLCNCSPFYLLSFI